jgi:iron complex outermembrane receptor protein
MNQARIVLTLFLLGIYNIPAQAQEGLVRGSILDLPADELPVVQLLRLPDSAVAKMTFADTNGSFEFDLIRNGNYLVSVSHAGYARFMSRPLSIDSVIKEQVLDPFALQRSDSRIEEVQIVASRPFIQRKTDRVVVNPDALIGNAGTSALEVLEKAPGVLVDGNGNISFKGRPGVMVFIDNKPSYLSPSDLADYLRSLPSGSIDVIELMSTPPAGYDAAGNAGIINIKLRRSAAKGFNGGINLSYGQGKYSRTNNSLQLNYRIERLNIFANLGISEQLSYQDLFINRYYFDNEGRLNSSFAQNSYIKSGRGARNARLGMDYYATDRSTFGFVLSGFINPSSSRLTNTASISDAEGQVMNHIYATSNSDRSWKNGGLNLNYTWKVDDKGRELSANADYIAYGSSQLQMLTNTIYDSGHQFTGSTQLSAELPADITIKTIKADYLHPIENYGRIEAGYKSSFVSTDNTAAYYDVVGDELLPNYEFSNRFKYSENIHAGYLNYAKEWSRFSLQLGLRAEHTTAKGHQLGNIMVKDSSFTRSYTSFFPTLFLSYKADSAQQHQFGLSAGRRINRPDYEDLNPFTYPFDRFTYYGGNPFLQPAFSYNFELSHTFRNMLTTTLEYSIVKNLIQETNEQRGNVYYSRPGNFGSHTFFGLSMNGNIPLTKWWTLMFYAEGKNIAVNSTLYGQQLDQNRWFAYVAPTCQFTLHPQWSAELAGSYQTHIFSGQFITIPVWTMRAGISHRILKGNGTVRLNVSDIAYSNQPGGEIIGIAQSKADWLSYLDSRVVTLNFSYRFSKGKTHEARQSGASDTERGRVRAS